MAAGDLSVFEEAMAYMIDGGWEAADEIWIALITDAVVPADGDTAPELADYTEVTAGGNYSAGGQLLATLGDMVTEAAGVVIVDDTGATTAWAADGSNPTDARYALVYNATQTGDPVWFWIDLGATFDLSAADLTLTWHANGAFRITKAA
jgi:hypothetical protein